MACDEALLRSFTLGGSQPVFRIYEWEPATLSLGRFQNCLEVLDLGRCRWDRMPIVRRISGGGVIYHAAELTYSLVCSPRHLPEAVSVKDGFRVLTRFLLGFYRRLGLEADYAVNVEPDGTRLGERTPFCFAGRETFDIVVAGLKIGGNAQRRTRGAIFQHGSIPLRNRAFEGLNYMRDRSPEQGLTAGSLDEFGIEADSATLKRTLADAFTAEMAVTLEASGLTVAEVALNRRLLDIKYSRDSWNIDGEIDEHQT